MNYDTVSLGDVCEFLDNQRVPITESDRKPGPYPYYGANGQQDSVDSYIFDEPLVLLAEDGGYFGSKDRPIAYKVTGKCWVNNHAHVLRPKSDIDVDYLHRVLSYYDVTKYVNGTTRQKLTKGNAENISFPLPPLTEQKRIASLLARADRLRQLRRTAHDLGDALLQSVFLEMFGDIARNEKGWEKYPISKYINVQGGYSFKSGDFIKAGVKVVKITNVHYGQLTWQDDTEFLPVEYLNKYSAFSLKTGDIVMSLTRPIIKSLNSVKVCQVQETDLPCLLNQRVGRLIIKNTQKIVPEFLLHFCYSQHFKAKVDDFLSDLCSQTLA